MPTEQSVNLALRTQQVLAHETGVADVVDPLGGSYYVEALTDEIEGGARALGELETAARGDANLLPVLVRAVETYATVGEMFDVLRGVFGEYRAVQAY